MDAMFSIGAFRPPVARPVPTPAKLLRPTVRPRAVIRPVLRRHKRGGFRISDPYVRRFWTAALGPGAVADLMRLASAARAGKSIKRPHHLSDLVRLGIAGHGPEGTWVLCTIPAVPRSLATRMPPDIRRQHKEWILAAALSERERLP